jgi:hypothetical protein
MFTNPRPGNAAIIIAYFYPYPTSSCSTLIYPWGFLQDVMQQISSRGEILIA